MHTPGLATRRSPLATQRGVTFVELIVSIVIISISLTAVVGVLSGMVGRSADPMIEHQAIAIADSYLEEILLKSYLDPGTGTVCPVPESSRALYDNVCDYNGLNDSGAHDQNGVAIAGLGGYQVQVSIDQAASLNGLSGSSQVLRVDVRVTYSNLVDITLSGYRTNY